MMMTMKPMLSVSATACNRALQNGMCSDLKRARLVQTQLLTYLSQNEYFRHLLQGTWSCQHQAAWQFPRVSCRNLGSRQAVVLALGLYTWPGWSHHHLPPLFLPALEVQTSSSLQTSLQKNIRVVISTEIFICMSGRINGPDCLFCLSQAETCLRSKRTLSPAPRTAVGSLKRLRKSSWESIVYGIYVCTGIIITRIIVDIEIVIRVCLPCLPA